MRTILNTHHVMTPNAYVHLGGDMDRVNVEHEKKLQMPQSHPPRVVNYGKTGVAEKRLLAGWLMF